MHKMRKTLNIIILLFLGAASATAFGAALVVPDRSTDLSDLPATVCTGQYLKGSAGSYTCSAAAEAADLTTHKDDMWSHAYKEPVQLIAPGLVLGATTDNYINPGVGDLLYKHALWLGSPQPPSYGPVITLDAVTDAPPFAFAWNTDTDMYLLVKIDGTYIYDPLNQAVSVLTFADIPNAFGIYIATAEAGGTYYVTVPPGQIAKLTYVTGGYRVSFLETQIFDAILLGNKVTGNAAITGATKTKITYDAKGLVTAGTDATTADIADSSNKRYVTDTQLANIHASGSDNQDLSGYAPLASPSFTGTVNITENTDIKLVAALSADGKYSGTTITGTGGATIAFGDLVTLDKDDSRWELVNISVAAAATGDARGLLGMAVTSSTDGTAITVMLTGTIRADVKFPTFTIGAPIYASTAGTITSTQPTTTDHVIRIIGWAITADSLYFNPDGTWITRN